MAHGYGELRMELVWNLSQKEVPALMEQLEGLLKVEVDFGKQPVGDCAQVPAGQGQG